MNIVIVGFMGTGKTTIAQALAKELGLKYIATDEVIEDKEKRSINDIFKRNGEAYFRLIEREVVKKVSELDKFVIDAGGGVVLAQENIDNLKRNGRLVCLRARAEVILERTKRFRHRPLLNSKNPQGKIESLLKLREPFYAQADFFIDTSDMPQEEIVQEIKRKIRDCFSESKEN
ncbi:MAG: shikimate kinase [Candidatus Omnitrophota bacterium]